MIAASIMTVAVFATSITSVNALSANAVTVTSSGGTNGTITVVANVKKSVTQPAGGVYVYRFGTETTITYPTITADQSIKGTVYGPSSSMKISGSGNVNSLYAYTTSGSSTTYNYCGSVFSSDTTAFGYFSKECNGNL